MVLLSDSAIKRLTDQVRVFKVALGAHNWPPVQMGYLLVTQETIWLHERVVHKMVRLLIHQLVIGACKHGIHKSWSHLIVNPVSIWWLTKHVLLNVSGLLRIHEVLPLHILSIVILMLFLESINFFIWLLKLVGVYRRAPRNSTWILRVVIVEKLQLFLLNYVALIHTNLIRSDNELIIWLRLQTVPSIIKIKYRWP